MSVGGIWGRYGHGNPSHRSDTGGWEACWLRCQLELFVTVVFLWRCWNVETPSGGHLCGSYFAKLVCQMLRFPRWWRRCSVCAVLRSFYHHDCVHHTVQQLLRDTGVRHSKDVARPSCLGLAYGGNDAREFRPLQHLGVGILSSQRILKMLRRHWRWNCWSCFSCRL